MLSLSGLRECKDLSFSEFSEMLNNVVGVKNDFKGIESRKRKQSVIQDNLGATIRMFIRKSIQINKIYGEMKLGTIKKVAKKRIRV